MARPPRYVFCRYMMAIGDDQLNVSAQRTLLADNQGTEVEHGREREGIMPTTLCSDPDPFKIGNRECISFFVGYKPGVRTKQNYNRHRKVWEKNVEFDDHTKSAHVVVVPGLSAMAILDKQSDENIPARQAIAALRSFIRHVAGDEDGVLEVTHATDDDIQRALTDWELTEYSYTARPLNPLPGTEQSRRRTRAYEAEGIGKETSRVFPSEGKEMKPNDGPLQETIDLWKDGYAQIGVQGDMPGGHRAQIEKSKFHQERSKNLKERQKPRFLRVHMEEDEEEPHFPTTIAKALVAFYQRDEA